MSASAALFTRRDLLKASGALVISFAFDAGGILGTQDAASGGADRTLDPEQVDSFLAIHPDGTITVYTGKADVGTGLRIAVAQMAAEELGVGTDVITVIDGDTGLCPDQGSTGGSTGLTVGGLGVRRAAATARVVLLELGASRLGGPAASLEILNGQVRPSAGGRGIGIGALIGGRRISRKVDPNAPFTSAPNYRIIGKPLPRPDVPAKVTGRHEYVQNVRLPNMLHARVLRPPIPGATIVSVDETPLGSIPGVRVVRIGDFLAVVSSDEWATVRAASALQVVWTPGESLSTHTELPTQVRAEAIDRDQVVVSKGDVVAGRTTVDKTVSATFFWPNQSHASLGPSCAVADVRPDGTSTVWSASQGTHALRRTLATVFGLPVEKMRIIFMEASGSYGTNGSDYVAADAVLLSKKEGRPVRVQWSRQDELRWDPKGPQQLVQITAGLDASHGIVAWDVEMWVPTTRPGPRALLAAREAGIPQTDGQGTGLLTQNADTPYAAEHVRVVAHFLKDTPLVPSNLRAPGKIANVFAVEAFTDELAALAGADPVDYRLRRLDDPRAIEVLTRATRTFGWNARPSPNPQARQGDILIGRGVAYMRYKQAENYVAMAMEVAVNPATGVLVVRRVVCAHDSGLIVNPDAIRNQIEGCIVQTISRAVHEEVTFDRGGVTSEDWSTYPVLAFPEAPAIDVILIDRPDQPLLGAGEAATAPVAGAIANAFYDATGVRLRTAPFSPARVKAALAGR